MGKSSKQQQFDRLYEQELWLYEQLDDQYEQHQKTLNAYNAIISTREQFVREHGEFKYRCT